MDQDWLDSRLAVQSYIPDDGFSARVVGSLPKKKAFALPARALILCTTGLLALCLLLWQLPAALESAGYFLSQHSKIVIPGQLISEVQQPVILLGAMIGVIMLSLVPVPLLRRLA